MKPGDTLVFGNGHRVKIVNFLKVNGQPGVQVDDPAALFASERFRLRADVDQMVKLGIWKIEAASAERSGNHE
jgi:hypothetical protein